MAEVYFETLQHTLRAAVLGILHFLHLRKAIH